MIVVQLLLNNMRMFRTVAQKLTRYATVQPDTQPDDWLCNRVVSCACSNIHVVDDGFV